MSMTQEEMRIELSREELDYPALAARLDAGDLALLEDFARSDDMMLATKAVYLSSLVDHAAAVDIVDAAARSGHQLVRIAAASALPNVPVARRNAIATRLLDDPMPEIKKLTLVAVDAPDAGLRTKIRALAAATPHDRLRELATLRAGGPN